ncbi:MAG: NAD-dependent epimerase/dehydratase family protein [Ktedonobacteraceae bacterium]|nr:NAD-dependent epimerase/dehydratase family protein [Ktedonobacteraceae bacterium]
MQIFILGATGYIGGAIAKHALHAGHTVQGLARSDQAEATLRERGIVPVRGSIDDHEKLAHTARKSDAVVFVVSYGNDIQAAMRSLSATVDALLLALEGSSKAFLFSSGVGAYGDTGNYEASEDEPIHPDPLFAPLIQMEQNILSAASRGVRSVVIRAAQVYGNGGGGSAPFVGLVDMARQMGYVMYVGEGTNAWSTIHLDDLANLYMLAMERAPAGTLLNAAAEPPVALKAIAEAVGRAAGLVDPPRSLLIDEANEVFGPFMTGFLARNMRISSARARALLDWQAEKPSVLDDLTHGTYGSPSTR